MYTKKEAFNGDLYQQNTRSFRGTSRLLVPKWRNFFIPSLHDKVDKEKYNPT